MRRGNPALNTVEKAASQRSMELEMVKVFRTIEERAKLLQNPNPQEMIANPQNAKVISFISVVICVLCQ